MLQGSDIRLVSKSVQPWNEPTHTQPSAHTAVALCPPSGLAKDRRAIAGDRAHGSEGGGGRSWAEPQQNSFAAILCIYIYNIFKSDLCMFLSIHPFIHLFIDLSLCLPTYLSLYLCIQLSLS